jgi:hypothetical protein
MVTIYTPDSSREVDETNYGKRNNRHWNDFYKYKAFSLHSKSAILIQAMVNEKKGKTKVFISSDIEIKKILDILGCSFLDDYRALGFLITPSAMLGIQLFEYCVFDRGYNWWYPIPKHQIEYHFPHSHYYLKTA